MAKQPETRHRFRIHAETSLAEMGPLVAQLTVMGLQNIGFELITDVAGWKGNSQRVKHETTAAEALAEYLKGNPTFQINDAIRHFEPLGRNKQAIYQAAKTMVANGDLVKLSPGNYSAPDVKAIEPPKKPKAAKEKKRPPTYRLETPNKDIIAKAIRGRTKFTMKLLKDTFVKNGHNPKSISPILTGMIKNKLIKVIAKGEYLILKKATMTKKPVKSAEQKLKEAHNKADRDRRAAKRAAQHNASLNGSSLTPESANG